MRISRFFYKGDLKENSIIILDALLAQRINHVLRLKKDDMIILFNGLGGEYRCKILSVQKSKIEVMVQSWQDTFTESSLEIHLGLGISRAEKMDYAVQKSIECGVQKITPLFTEFGGVHLEGDRLEKRLHHWQAIAVSATEQCERVRVPEILTPTPILNWIKNNHCDLNLICDTKNKQTLIKDCSLQKNQKKISLLIGSEGGFSEKEKSFAEKNNFISIFLGPRILRTETAPVVALTLLQSHFGDL